MDTKKIEDKIREIINWLEAFKTEYDLPAEAHDKLRSQLEELAGIVGSSE